MKKMMFNDRFGLTDAVIEKRKTVTRRMVCKPDHDEVFDNSVDRFNKGWIDHIELIGYKRVYVYKPPYAIGEIVAIAQSYKDCGEFDVYEAPKDTAGWKNKMFVKADLMPRQIRILDIRAERLQDITDEDCLREGVIKYTKDKTVYKYDLDDGFEMFLWRDMKRTPREAFAALINKISGKGTWESNPFVWRIEFEYINK